jgi:RNA polymerase sigma-70 factor, ECF subfamily
MANCLAPASVTVESAHRADHIENVPTPESPLDLVYRLHSRHLNRFLLRLTFGDRREAEDLLQETLLRAWRQLRDHGGNPERLRPWLFTVARRVAMDAARARKARPAEVILLDACVLPERHDDIERTLVALTIRRGLQSLSPDHRRVLIEVFYRGRTVREVSQTLGIPEGTVKSRTFYAVRALAASIGVGQAKP